MTTFRPPIVAGVSGGVGTTTLALALHGRDAGTDTAEADVLVCRSSVESLDRATRIADLARPGRYPVLLVTLDGTERRPPARLARLSDRWTTVVPVPHVAPWRELVDPYREAAGLLGASRAGLPRSVRSLLDAIARAAQATADSGRLSGPVGSGGDASTAAWPNAGYGSPAPTWPHATPWAGVAHASPTRFGPADSLVPVSPTRPDAPAGAWSHGLASPSQPTPPGEDPRTARVAGESPPPYADTPLPPAAGARSPASGRDGLDPWSPGAPAIPSVDGPPALGPDQHAATADGFGEPLRLVHSPVESTVDSTGCGAPERRLAELRPVRGIRVLDAGGMAG